ncbi:hypothetical protein K466DRAFT_284529 [Polyporus arcularius HHB13444]|uniref:Uncharacterized protein n=1 Tax=Polyporus arcularius HHB13444 TaxID=1314778 RepID=A0A5C3NZL5_9APHY|nr:hypothetical protein K466DRAFT_284529 [Polyporus arcularius HHB13444]
MNVDVNVDAAAHGGPGRMLSLCCTGTYCRWAALSTSDLASSCVVHNTAQRLRSALLLAVLRTVVSTRGVLHLPTSRRVRPGNDLSRTHSTDPTTSFSLQSRSPKRKRSGPTRTPEPAKYAIATSRAGRDVESLTFRGRVPGSPTGAAMNA